MEYSLATLMLNIVNDEKLNMEKTILHHKEGVDLIPANIELSAIEVSLVNAMSREVRNYVRLTYLSLIFF